jgi:hypothetical protein
LKFINLAVGMDHPTPKGFFPHEGGAPNLFRL